MGPRQTEESDLVLAPELVERVRTNRGKMSTRQRIDGARSFGARVGRGPRASSVAPWWAIGMGLMILAVTAALVWSRSRTSPLDLTVDGARLGRAGVIEAEAAGRPLRFSDGSEVLLSSDAVGQLRSVDAAGARLSLTSGTAHVDIVHRLGARWTFDAGPFSIAVTGTAFRFGWKVADQQLDVWMERGTVEVSGPLSDAAITLRSGQHLTVRLPQRETLIREFDDQAIPALAPTAVLSASATSSEPASAPVASAMPAMREPSLQRPNPTRGPSVSDWSALLAAGDFEGVVQRAANRGLETCLNDSSSRDLALLADAARYSRHQDVARKALLAERRRFSQSRTAHEAAFLLGRLEESDHRLRGALDWYGRYLAESPDGTYASEALGREMLLSQEQGMAQQAAALAQEYLMRFPAGAYAEQARGLMRTP